MSLLPMPEGDRQRLCRKCVCPTSGFSLELRWEWRRALRSSRSTKLLDIVLSTLRFTASSRHS